MTGPKFLVGTDGHMHHAWNRLTPHQQDCLIDHYCAPVGTWKRPTRQALRRAGLMADLATLSEHGAEVVRWACNTGRVQPPAPLEAAS